MIFAIAIGVLSAFVILIAMARINLKRFMGYPAVMDVLVTVVLIWMLHGSYVGMVAAVIGGLFFSGMITVIRRMYGYSKLERRGMRFVWVEHNVNHNNSGVMQLCLKLKSQKPLTWFIVGSFVLLFVL